MNNFPKNTDNKAGCVPNSNYLTLAGFSAGGFRVYQALKTLDFMGLLGITDDIAVFGISGGGMTTQQLFPIDDRLKYGIVACYSNTYEDGVLAKAHCVCNYVPGLLRLGDSAQMLALAAPKKLMTMNGTRDRAFPLAGSEKAVAYLHEIYDMLGAPEMYDGVLFDGVHEIKEDIVIDWLKRQMI